MLKINELSKQFGTHLAVNNLSIEIEKGQVFGLLGRNGAGKSTTVKMILGLVEPTAGEITWNGKPTHNSGVSIGYLPEERGLYSKSTVNRQLSYFGKLEGMSTKEVNSTIDRWLERLEIPQYKHKKVSDLSKGNQQKIQLIATLLHNPELVILDEPFSGLDPVNANMFAEVIHEEIVKGKTVIMSSHRMDKVEEFCDDVCLLKEGITVVHGCLNDIKNEYEFRNLILTADMSVRNGLDALKIAYTDEKNGLLIKVVSDACALNVLNQLSNSGVGIPQFQLLRPTLEQIFIERVG